MWCLALDTSGVTQAVVLLHADGRCHMRHSAERRQQGELLEGFIKECVAGAGIGLKDVAVIAAVTGPGSFTGLRIGLACAQGLARATGCRVAGYDRFSLLGAVAPEAVIVLESLRAELFVRFPGSEPAMLLPDEIRTKLSGRNVVGDGVPQLGLQSVSVPPEAELAARHALADIASGKALAPLQPLYVRPPDVTFPKAAP